MVQDKREAKSVRTMKADKRKLLRIDLLTAVYDNHFESRGEELIISKKGLETETALAYDYLKECGYVKTRPIGSEGVAMKITAIGINVVESI